MPDGIRRELLLREELVQAHELLVDDPAGADVLVADLAVAHHAVRQADIEAAGGDEGVGRPGVEPVVTRLRGEVDGVEIVLLGLGILAPTIANDEEDGWTG